jgi:Uma2 family endonuclease
MAGVKAAQERVSYADLERWPEDGRRYELYNGEVFEIPAPLLLHQFVLGRLFLALSAYVQVRGGSVFVAPLDIVLTDFDVVQPDVLLFTPEREHLLDMRKVTRHAPDLAIEILSRGTSRNDRGRKLRLFERHRVQEYWLVEPDGPSVEVYRLSGTRLVLAALARGGEPIESALLPELDLRPSGLLPTSATESRHRTEG